jgi:hypothetical protein
MCKYFNRFFDRSGVSSRIGRVYFDDFNQVQGRQNTVRVQIGRVSTAKGNGNK